MLTPFITNAQFLSRYDYRWVGMNLLDDDSDATEADLLSTSTVAGGRIQLFAFEASEMLMGACAVGARYSEDDVRTYGGYLKLRICADLMIAPVLKRRDRALTDESALSKAYDEALQYLEQLRRGERIFFQVPDVPEAGLPTTSDMGPIFGVDPPLITQEAIRYFGLPIGAIYPYGYRAS